jgi:FkbM family methyltransferase
MLSFGSAAVGSYAQYGEDLVIDGVLGSPATGFYVDIGANDPVVFSNTKRFYDRGWTGINVEPNPDLAYLLRGARPSDINLNLGVGSEDTELSFNWIDPDTLSTFDRQTAERNVADYKGARIIKVVPVAVQTLASILSQHIQEVQTIDFLSLDVEGEELGALAGNDWTTWRPRLVMVEVNRSGSEIVDFMSGVGYDFVWCNGTNGLFAPR